MDGTANGTGAAGGKGNPIFGFLGLRPSGTGPAAMVTRTLRTLGLVVLARVALSVLGLALLSTTMSDFGLDGPMAGVAVVGGVIGAVIGIAVALAFCFWITYAGRAWEARAPSGPGHVLGVGIVGTVFGGLGVMGGLFGLAFSGALGMFGALEMVRMLLGLAVSVAEAVCGILLLVNRGKAMQPAPYAPAPMA